MSRRSDQVPAAVFKPVLRDIARWRSGRVRGARMPEDLWAEAVRLAHEHGAWKTARVLRLDYYSLKRRLEGSGPRTAQPRARSDAAFVEVPLGLSAPPPECVLQLEDAERGRLRIELRGGAASDVEALALSLWSAAR